jgi:molybdopterin converting factor small subunit
MKFYTGHKIGTHLSEIRSKIEAKRKLEEEKREANRIANARNERDLNIGHLPMEEQDNFR